MYHKILVPLDGSPFSEEALPLAIGVARRTGAELRLLHVMESLYGKVIESEAAITDEMDGLARRIMEAAGVTAMVGVRRGEAVPEICAYIEEEGIDLVVMATHGWGGIRRAWLGSVTDELVRAAKVPLLVVRPQGGEPAAAPPEGAAVGSGHPPLQGAEIRHALLTLDGSDLAESAVEPLLALAGPDARYTLLRVVPIPIPGDAMTAGWDPALWQDLLPTLRDEARDYLDRFAAQLRERVREVEIDVLIELSPASAIIDYAAQHDIDLIAMATHGHGGIRRVALGSVTDKVLRGADAPVLISGPRFRFPNSSGSAESAMRE